MMTSLTFKTKYINYSKLDAEILATILIVKANKENKKEIIIIDGSIKWKKKYTNSGNRTPARYVKCHTQTNLAGADL